jgi:hypothetical protein
MFLDLCRIREHQEGIASALDTVVGSLDTSCCLGHLHHPEFRFRWQVCHLIGFVCDIGLGTSRVTGTVLFVQDVVYNLAFSSARLCLLTLNAFTVT